MGNAKNSAGKRVFDDVYSFPQDSQDLADDVFEFANVRSGTSAQRQALPVAQRRVGMQWDETDTGIPYLDTASSGWIPTGARFIGCKMRRAATQSLVSGNFTTIALDTEVFDVGGLWTPGNPTQLVAPVSGVYRVDATGGFGPVLTGRVGLQFLKNGSIEYGGQMVNPGGGGDVSAQASTLVNMDAGDALVMQLFQESGSARNTATSAYAGPTIAMQLLGGV